MRTTETTCHNIHGLTYLQLRWPRKCDPSISARLLRSCRPIRRRGHPPFGASRQRRSSTCYCAPKQSISDNAATWDDHPYRPLTFPVYGCQLQGRLTHVLKSITTIFIALRMLNRKSDHGTLLGDNMNCLTNMKTAQTLSSLQHHTDTAARLL